MFSFYYLHPGASNAEIEELTAKRRAMSKMAVEGTIQAIRRLIKEGKIN
jgi:hypothetical protein